MAGRSTRVIRVLTRNQSLDLLQPDQMALNLMTFVVLRERRCKGLSTLELQPGPPHNE